MGASLYERYLAEQEPPKGGGLYEQYQKTQKKPMPKMELDIKFPSETTSALPYDKDRPGDFAAMRSAPAGLKEVVPEAAKGASALALSASQAVPGMERFQASMGALGDLTYDESLAALRSETDKIPKEVKFAAQMMTGVGAAKALPMLSPAKAGAVFGGGSQALSADNMTLEDRLARTAVGGAGGAVVGKSLESLLTGARAAATPGVGKNAMDRVRSMKAADKVNYGRAANEGTAATSNVVGPVASPAQQGVRSVLDMDEIKPFADMVRGAKQFASADDATVLRETYKLMSKQQTGLARQLKEQGFDAAKQLQHDNIALAKQDLLKAADAVMPSFRGAVQSHAKASSAIDALDVGRRAGQRAISKSAGARASTQSAEALEDRIRKMSPEEQRAAVEGILGRLKETIGIQPNAVSMGGALTTAIRPARVAPLLRNIGDPTTRLLDDLVRGGLLSGSSVLP